MTMSWERLCTRLLCGVTACLVPLLLSGCGDSPTAGAPDGQSEGQYTIVCTTGMVSDIVQQVAGTRATVVTLMGEGVDPHLYVPTRSDVVRLRDADVIFYSGLLLEGQMQHTFETLSSNGKPVFAVTADLSQSELLAPPEFEGHPDPHVWNDVTLWSRAVETIATRLGEYDAERAEEYHERSAAYRQQLEALDDYARSTIASIPQSGRYLVTAHDAFGYFSRAYGIPVESVQGITTESEPGVDDINRLVDLLVSKKLPAIFVESSVNSANLEAVVSGAQSRNWEVKHGGTLFSDAMGAQGTYEGTYIGMIDHNVTTIAQALGGQAPERGMQGKLGNRKP
ncbi:MAG: metal ABC transporter solute-binding protein, Zn/Mn family [Planctomycetaceae bacterium]